MPARIAGEESETAATLDQRSEIGFAIFSLEDQEIAFPMAKAAAVRDFLRPRANRVGHGNMEVARLSAIALPARTASNRQMAPQLMVPPIRFLDILIDGFVAHRRADTPVTAKIARNLLWQPSCRQSVGDVRGELRPTSDLAAADTTAVGHGLRGRGKIAAKQRMLIQALVAFELAINRRRMATQRIHDLPNRPSIDKYSGALPNPDADSSSSCAFLERGSNPHKS